MTYKDERYYSMVAHHVDSMDDEQQLTVIEQGFGSEVVQNTLGDIGDDIVGNPYTALFLRGMLIGMYLLRAKVAYELAGMQAITLADYFGMCFSFPPVDVNGTQEGDGQ